MSAADREFAVRAAQAAGDYLLRLQGADTYTGTALGDAGDAGANELLLRLLAAEYPTDGVLSEESADDKRRLGLPRVWIIDPLDGTSEFRAGRPDWAVHVALLEDGVLTAGAVAMPTVGATYGSDGVVPRGTRALLPPPTAGQGLRIVVSRSRPPWQAQRLAQDLGATLLPLGSAGAKAMAVLRGEADAYVHSGGQYEWDSAAPVAVAQAAGLWCSRLDGEPLRYNNFDTYLPDLLIARAEVAPGLLQALQQSS